MLTDSDERGTQNSSKFVRIDDASEYISYLLDLADSEVIRKCFYIFNLKGVGVVSITQKNGFEFWNGLD